MPKLDAMTREEYNQKKIDLQKELDIKLSNLMREYVKSNNPYKIGDIITDHMGTIIYETMKYSWGYDDNPCAVYYGTELKKDGTPAKKQFYRGVYQSNIIKPC